ncbi:MAG: benzoate-CoA ligase family protein [Gammaproteobacteria bacterium]|nr:benzoate-CoA ligase family protein [Gammaproteobacteria bacterium]
MTDLAGTAVPAPPQRFNFAQHLFALNAARADRLACLDDAGRLSYGELELQARRCATALIASGLRREERVLLAMHDCSDWPVAFLGALYAGIVPVCVNTLLSADDFAFMLAHSRAQAVITSAPLVPVMHAAIAQGKSEVHTLVVSRATELPEGALAFPEWLRGRRPVAAPADTAADEVAFWMYSSGSTGRPKGTLHTHANAYWTAELYGRRTLGLTEHDLCFSAAKLFFAYGLGNSLFFPFSVGASVLLMAERPTPPAIFRRWLEHRPTVFFCAPTGYAGVLASPDLPAREAVALRLCSSAGEALPRELGERFAAHFGIDVIDGIGSTEMLHIFLSNRPGDVRYGTSGKPVEGYEIELRDEAGRPISAAGQIGDLYIRGPSSALMYWQDRARSDATFQGGWTRSGDKYERDADGYYVYSGRSDDMLKVSGQYVSPFEVEATLVGHPAVLEAALIGVTDADGLTRAQAYVVLKDRQQAAPALAAELQQFVKARLAPHKYPRVVEFLDELPKTATGKIQRFRLRERARQTQ